MAVPGGEGALRAGVDEELGVTGDHGVDPRRWERERADVDVGRRTGVLPHYDVASVVISEVWWATGDPGVDPRRGERDRAEVDVGRRTGVLPHYDVASVVISEVWWATGLG